MDCGHKAMGLPPNSTKSFWYMCVLEEIWDVFATPSVVKRKWYDQFWMPITLVWVGKSARKHMLVNQ
jgi:hypothetical protein